MTDPLHSFESERNHLTALSYRMLGSRADAEDVVQESWLRWRTQSNIQNPRAWLTRIVTNLCIDCVRQQQSRREEYPGPWLPEPVVGEEVENTAFAETLTFGFLKILERLSPSERAVFLLREAFDYGFDEIASVIGKSEANCRQVLKRALDAVRSDRSRFDTNPAEGERLVLAFCEATRTGDLETLESLLADDVILVSDGGGKRSAATQPVHGRRAVSRLYAGLHRVVPEGLVGESCIVNNRPGFVLRFGTGEVFSVTSFEFAAGRIVAISTVLNPDKLQNV